MVKIIYLILCFILYLQVTTMKIINIYPGGLHGFYMLGICKYIKKNYNLQDYKYYGASAGSWNSLFLCYNKNDEKFIQVINNLFIDERPKNIHQLQLKMKNILLESYDNTDFDLDKIHISVAEIQKPPFKIKKKIYTGFDSLDNVTNCCIASSHLPILSGKIGYKYNNHYCLDGGIFINPFLNNDNDTLNIGPFMWKNKKKYKNNLKHLNIEESIINGYEDAEKNKNELDYYLL